MNDNQRLNALEVALNNELREVRDVLVASLLMYYDPVLEELGDQSIIIKAI